LGPHHPHSRPALSVLPHRYIPNSSSSSTTTTPATAAAAAAVPGEGVTVGRSITILTWVGMDMGTAMGMVALATLP